MTKIKPKQIILFMLFLLIAFIFYTHFSNKLYETFGGGLGNRGGGSIGGVAIASRKSEKNNANNVLDNNKQETPFYFPFYSNDANYTQNNNSSYYGASNNKQMVNRSCGMCGMIEVV